MIKQPILIVVSFILAQNISAQILTVEICNIRNKKGILHIAIFENSQQFKDETPSEIIYLDKCDIIGGRTYVDINLKPSTYGITVLDDEDKNGDMSFKLLYPKEGIGFSNFVLNGLSKPKFSDFSFRFSKSEKVKVEMKYF